jgi:hypothetical protein
MPELLSLSDIQKLQFHDKTMAELQLLEFLQNHEDRSIQIVELRPKPESLNSINGFLTYANGEKYFFKAHVEENEKLSEYYNASVLAKAGYPVITAKRIKQHPGQQIALYEIVSLPTLFDQLKVEEDLQKEQAQPSQHCQMLQEAQTDLETIVKEIYKNTLTHLTADQHAQAPIHQLFSHRLAQDGRVGLFYSGKVLALKNKHISFDQLSHLQWVINGASYTSSLRLLIERSRELLAPKAGPAIVGHGDAHNGNIFVDGIARKFVMFDPAFAGVHDPLLDMAKPLFHNTFARWMYFPDQVQSEFELSYELKSGVIKIDHSYKVSPLRIKLLQVKKDHLLKPVIEHLRKSGVLVETWRETIRCALFCCPLLTVNLFAPRASGGTLAEKYSPEVRLLAFSIAVEMASRPETGNNELSQLIEDCLS